MIEFFARTGRVVCYATDDLHIYTWAGGPVAYIAQDKVYAYSGRLLGWFDGGWLYDRQNRPALFSAGSSGGPVRPVRQVKPVRGVRGVRPVKGVRAVAHVRGVKSLSWSDVADDAYFDQ